MPMFFFQIGEMTSMKDKNYVFGLLDSDMPDLKIIFIASR
jgi:hypothetical protein